MSKKLSQEEIKILTGIESISELDTLKSCLDYCLDKGTETLSSIININNIECGKAEVELIKASEFEFNNDDLTVRIELKNGLSGFSFLGVSNSLSNKIVKSMIGDLEDFPLSIDIIENAICEVTNQLVGSLCTTLSSSIDDTIDITIPTIFSKNTLSVESIFNESFTNDSYIYKISYRLNVLNENISLMFAFHLNSAKKAIFKIKTTQSKNLLALNPELSNNIVEYFSSLSVKYKAIYSMIGIIDDISILNLHSIHSLQCLNVDVINNYNIINTNKSNDLYNIYIFEKNFVTDVKKNIDFLDNEDNTWDILKELNNQFNYTFLEHCSDNNLEFDSVECNNFLELPDNQYLLVSFSVDNYKFYQLLSFALIDKIKVNFNSDSKSLINTKNIENSTKDSYSLKNQDSTHFDLKDIPILFRQMSFEVSAELGEKDYIIQELLHFDVGSIIHFDKKVTDYIDIYINHVKKAEGEVGQLTYNKSNNYAVKIKKIIKE